MAKKKQTIEQYRYRFVLATLRRASYRWYARQGALLAARTGSIGRLFTYKCAWDTAHKLPWKSKNRFTRKEIQIDHITPIVPLTGWDSWDKLIERLFCKEEDLQVLCKPCHHTKTQKENKIRRNNGHV